MFVNVEQYAASVLLTCIGLYNCIGCPIPQTIDSYILSHFLTHATASAHQRPSSLVKRHMRTRNIPARFPSFATIRLISKPSERVPLALSTSVATLSHSQVRNDPASIATTCDLVPYPAVALSLRQPPRDGAAYR